MGYLLIVDDITGRRILIIQGSGMKNYIAVEDDTPATIPFRSVPRVIRNWMKSVRNDNPCS